MLGIAEDNWQALDGFAVSQGMAELGRLRLPRFLNFVHWWATRNIEDERDMAAFENKLWMPPAGVVAVKGPWSAAAETASFNALKNALGK